MRRSDFRYFTGFGIGISNVYNNIYSGVLNLFQTETKILSPSTVKAGDSFVLSNDYGWLSIHPTTGVITADSTDLISGRFNVSVEITNGGSTIIHELTVSVYYANSQVKSKNDTSFVLGEVVKSIPLAGNKAQTSYKVPSSIDSTKWHYITPYKPSYSYAESDIVIVDHNLITTTVLQEDAKGYNFNLTHSVITDQGNLDVNVMRSSDNRRKIMTYSPIGKIVSYDTVIIPTTFGGEESQINLNRYYPNEAFINGQDGSYMRIGKYNTSSRVFTDIAQIGNSRTSPRALAIAGDNDYIYSVVGREPNVELYQTTHDGLTTTLIASSSDNLGDIDLEQYRWGVRAKFKDVVGYADGYWYLYNNNITDGSNPDVTPWTAQDGIYDLTGPEEFTRGAYHTLNIGTTASNGDVNATVVADSQETDYSYTVRSYASKLFNLINSGSNSMVIAASDYAGLSEVETSTFTGIDFGAHASRIRMVRAGRYIYFGGYPSWAMFEYDTQTNTVRSLGYAGGTSNPSSGHWIQGLVFHNGFVYIFGNQYRVGVSGAVGYFDPYDFDGTIGGFSDQNDPSATPDLSDYAFNNTVVIGDEIVASSYITSGSSATVALLYIFDTVTKKLVRTIPLGTDIKTTGFIVGVSDTEIFGITAKPDLSAVMYKVNISTNTVVYKEYPANLRSTIIQDTIQLFEQSIIFKDGFVFSNIYDNNSTHHIIKIEHEICGIEFLGNSSNEPFTIDESGDAYLISVSGELKEKKSMDSINNMPMVVLVAGAELLQYPNFNGDEFINGTDFTIGGGQCVFNDTGGSDYFYGNVGITASITYRVRVDIDSLSGSSLRVRFGSTNEYYFPVGITEIDITISSSSTSNNLTFIVGSLTSAILNSFSVKPLENVL